jgi:glycosyltransferase involved in cell wall biosynthesis
MVLFPMKSSSVDISVVIPCFNCEETLERAVESVCGQTVLPREIILVDDCSNEATRIEMQRLSQIYTSPRVLLFYSEVNRGAAAARNRGWSESSGEYIAFLDADDSWHPQKLELQAQVVKENKPNLVGCSFAVCNDTVPDVNQVSDFEVSEVKPVTLLLKNILPTPGVILRANLPFRFDPEKRYSEDYKLWLEICLKAGACYKLEVSLVYLYKAPFGASGLSADFSKAQAGELDTYRSLLQQRLINPFTFGFLWLLSNIKYVRRLVMRSRQSI